MEGEAHELAFGPQHIEVVAPELEGRLRRQHAVDEEVVVVVVGGGWKIDERWLGRIGRCEGGEIAIWNIHHPRESEFLSDPVGCVVVTPASGLVSAGSVAGQALER